MNHSPHANFSTSFGKRVIVHLLLLASLIFGVLNAVDAFALSSRNTKNKRPIVNKVMVVKEQQVILDAPSTQLLITDTSKPTAQPSELIKEKSAPSFTALDFFKLNGTQFQPFSISNYVKANSAHLELINGTRISSTSNLIPLTGAGVTIGIIDSGLNLGLNTFLDQNGNSRIVSQSCFGNVFEIAPCDQENPAHVECGQIDVGCIHGNAVADLAAGSRYSVTLNDGRIISTGGVAPGANISFARLTLSANGELDESLLVDALNKFLIDVQSDSFIAPDIINISIGFPRDGKFANCEAPSEIKNLIDRLVEKNVVVVASSGNGGNKDKIMFPACLDKVISVGASANTANGETVSSFSQTSYELDVLAPGTGIMATRPIVNSYSSVRGTSFATPLVTGSIALLKQANPTLTPLQIRETLISNGDIVTDAANSASFPRINVLKALQSFDGFGTRFEDPIV